MHKAELQCGVKGFSVTVQFDEPDNDKDVITASRGDESYRTAMFNRGHRIRLQDGCARGVVLLMLNGKSPELMSRDTEFVAKVKRAVELELEKFNPTERQARVGVPKAPPAVAIDTTKKQYSLADLQALLKAQGFTVIETEAK